MGKTIYFWLLDVSKNIVNEQKSEIRLWGVSKEGERILLIRDGVVQTFYVKLESYEDPEAEIKRFNKLLPHESMVKSFKVGKRKIFGRETVCAELNCNPYWFKEVVKEAKKFFGEEKLFEDDLNISRQFLLKNDLTPSTWFKASVEELKSIKLKGVDRIYRVNEIGKIELDEPPKLKVMGLDVVYFARKGEPRPEKDPVAIISVCTDKGLKKQFILENSENELLKGFIDFTSAFNPDVMVTFGGNTVHLAYLSIRAEKNNLKLSIGKLNEPPHPSIFGHVSLVGRVHFDLKDFTEEIAMVEHKTFQELISFLGLDKGEIEHINPIHFSEFWSQGGEKRNNLLKYSSWRAAKMVEAFQLIQNQIISLSQITGMPMDYVYAASPGYRLENYLMREAIKHCELIPKATEKIVRSYTGGKVLQPKPGLHRNIAVVDFKSMYPSLMLKHNISPDTIVTKPFPKGYKVLEVEGTNIGIVQDRRGFFTDILEKLVRERDSIKEMLKETRETVKYWLLETRQKTLKILANAMYGYMGWTGARWFIRAGAEAVAALGRKVVTETIEKADEIGLKVVYGDTDSVFIEYDEEKTNKLLNWISEELGLKAKIDKVYSKVIFTEAKKRYAGITGDGKLDVVGLEMVRRDWCNYARETQKGLLEILLKGKGVEEAVGYISERVKLLRQGRFTLEDLIIWEQITRSLEDYVANAPHISVAKELMRKGWEVKKGDYIGYLICKGEGPLYTRSKHYTEVKVKEVDIDYYIEKQILPVCSRIMRVLGVSRKKLESLVASAGRGLEMFF